MSTRCSTTSASIGSPTVPHRLLASTGRIPAPARQAFPKGGSNCLWRRRSSRTRFSARLEHGPRRYGRTCSIGMSSTKAGISPHSSNRLSSPKSCETPSGHGAPSELAGGDACRHAFLTCGATQLCQINAVNFWDSPLAQSQSLRPPEWWSHKVIPRAEGRRQYQHNLRLQILPRSELSTVVEVGSHSPGKCNFWELPSRNTPELGLDNSLRYAAAKD